MLNIVADLSHHNTNPDVPDGKLNFRQAYDAGLRGVLHKATEGTWFVDPTYAARRAPAGAAGMLWGAYHFGRDADGLDQANYFLEHAEADAHTLLMLDFEQPPGNAPGMTTHQAEQFVQQIHQRTGRYPGLYSNPAYLLQAGAHQSTILQQCWLCIACYEARPEPPHQPGWLHWTMWQYTNSVYGQPPHNLTGIGPCDRDIFNGELTGLRRLWGYPTEPATPIAAAQAAPALPPLPASSGPDGQPAPTSLRATLTSEALHFCLTLLVSVPVAHALRQELLARLISLAQALENLHLAGWEHYLLVALVVAGCYVARLAAAHIGTIAATTPAKAASPDALAI